MQRPNLVYLFAPLPLRPLDLTPWLPPGTTPIPSTLWPPRATGITNTPPTSTDNTTTPFTTATTNTNPDVAWVTPPPTTHLPLRATQLPTTKTSQAARIHAAIRKSFAKKQAKQDMQFWDLTHTNTNKTDAINSDSDTSEGNTHTDLDLTPPQLDPTLTKAHATCLLQLKQLMRLTQKN